MNNQYNKTYSNLNSRGRKLCDIVLNSTTSRNVTVVVENLPDNEEELLPNNDVEIKDRFLESPLPEGANLSDIEALSKMIFNDLVNDEGTNLTDNNSFSDPSQHSPQNDENIPNDSMQCSKSSDTHYPSSPECSTNHLDADCCNDFCPYFIGNQIREPLSQLSNFTGYSTPQANTPLTCYSSDAAPSPGRKKVLRKDKGKVRRQHKNEWIDVKRKTLKNLGEAYVTRKGIQKQKKAMKPPCKCRLKCFEKISEEQRKAIFDAFWKLGDHHKQWIYVSNLVSQNLKRRVYVDTQSRRKYTMKYKLPLPVAASSDESHLIVCKKQFLSTLSISEQFVYTAIQKTDSSTGTVSFDNRGKHQNHPRKITEDIKKSVCDHIKCLEPVEAHYVRKDNSKLYLDSDLNFHKLFAMYEYNEWFDPNVYESKAETERQYKTIACENFKLYFYKPKKDQCDLCHTYKANESRTELQSETYHNHILNKNIARALKAEDKKEAISSNGKIISATFDFQKVLTSPYGEVSVFYYKRKLATMNFTIFSLATKTATCYMWHEAEGKRGANEVSSCLADFIAKGVETGAVEFRFWSDNATGQNRNRIVFAAYMLLAQKYNVTIKHTFLEKGHTQQEGDSVHALIERSAKNKYIYTPMEWFALVRWAKQDEKPYNVIEMDHTRFFDYKSTLGSKNWAKNLDGEVVQWSKIKEVKVVPSEPNKLLYKYNLHESHYMTIVTKTNTRRRQQENSNVPPLYNDVLPITLVKKKDLLSLCKSGIIPAVHRSFYESLPTISQNVPIPTPDTYSDTESD